jgi:FkbM family methyltransferase
MIERIVRESIRFVPWPLRSAIKRVPVLAWFQKTLLRKVLEGQEFVHRIDAGPAKGLVFPVILPDDKGVWTGTYELNFVQLLAAAVRPGTCCLDVGGWRGYCAGVMACAGARSTYVFEPLPANGVRIQRMIELNPKLSIQLNAVAVGKEDGKATFHIMPQTSMGKLGDSPFQQSNPGGQRLDVEVVSLDSWSRKHSVKNVSVIKLDVEGAELMALEGAASLIDRDKPQFFVEAHSRDLAAQVTEFLEKRGYKVTTLETGHRPDGVSEPEVCHLRAAVLAN